MDKFKVWCINNNEWEKDICVLTQDGHLLHRIRNMWVPLRKDTHEVVKPTGIKDINKKESYLGDILKEPKPTYGYEESKDHKKAFYIIKKENDSNNMYLEYKFNTRGLWEKNKLPLCRIEKLEIVGDIYNNADLIKKEV